MNALTDVFSQFYWTSSFSLIWRFTHHRRNRRASFSPYARALVLPTSRSDRRQWRLKWPIILIIINASTSANALNFKKTHEVQLWVQTREICEWCWVYHELSGRQMLFAHRGSVWSRQCPGVLQVHQNAFPWSLVAETW